MEPELVLQTLKQKETISLIEAEQGLLASYLAAMESQDADDGAEFRERYGTRFDTELETAITKEYKDAIFRNEKDEGDLSKDVLRDTCTAMDKRLKVDDWPDDVADDHTDRCQDIIAKATDQS